MNDNVEVIGEFITLNLILTDLKTQWVFVEWKKNRKAERGTPQTPQSDLIRGIVYPTFSTKGTRARLFYCIASAA